MTEVQFRKIVLDYVNSLDHTRRLFTRNVFRVLGASMFWFGLVAAIVYAFSGSAFYALCAAVTLTGLRLFGNNYK